MTGPSKRAMDWARDVVRCVCGEVSFGRACGKGCPRGRVAHALDAFVPQRSSAELKVLHAAHAAGKVSDCPTCAVPQPSAPAAARELMFAQALAQARRQGAGAMRERILGKTTRFIDSFKQTAEQLRDLYPDEHERHACLKTAGESLEGLAAAIRALPDEGETP